DLAGDRQGIPTGFRFRCRSVGDYLALVQDLGQRDLHLACTRCALGNRAGAHKIPWAQHSGCFDQYRNGSAAGGGRVIRIDFFVAQRSPGILGTDLFADGDGDRSGDHCFSHRRRVESRELPALDPKLALQLLGIGASKAQLLWLLCKEARLPLLAAVMAGFGGVISEVGASMMVGGNIRGETRVLTTATVLETGKGNFDVAIALSLILLGLTFAINFILTRIQQQEQLRWPKIS